MAFFLFGVCRSGIADSTKTMDVQRGSAIQGGGGMCSGGLGGWQIGGIATAEQINCEPLISTFQKKEKNDDLCTYPVRSYITLI